MASNKTNGKYDIGVIRSSNNYGDYTIIDKVKSIYTIKFNTSGYILKVNSTKLNSGEIRDPFFPKVEGVGFTGVGKYQVTIKGKMTKQYRAWSGMLARCYNLNYLITCPTYNNVKVCKEWHNFQTFCKDIEKIEGFTEWCKDSTIHLDKDYLQQRVKDKIYDKHTVKFIKNSLNTILSNYSVSTYEGIDPLGVAHIFSNQKEFAKLHGLSRRGISSVVTCKQVTHRGWTFKRL